jgi:hypothetical protein
MRTRAMLRRRCDGATARPILIEASGLDCLLTELTDSLQRTVGLVSDSPARTVAAAFGLILTDPHYMRASRSSSATTTLLAVVDRREHVLLRRVFGQTLWLPISARVITIRPTKVSIISLFTPLSSPHFLAVTPVMGRFTPLPEKNPDRATHSRVFVVRHEKVGAITANEGAASNIEYSWHPITEVETEGFNVCPRELGVFLRGYLEGWIPDGTITLVE